MVAMAHSPESSPTPTVPASAGPQPVRGGLQLPLAVISATIGILVALQIKSLAYKPTEPPLPSRREEDIAGLIKASEAKQEELGLEIERLKKQIKDRLDPTSESVQAVPPPANEAWQAQVVAGTTPVSGPGLVLTLDDAHTPLGQGENPNNAIVHNEDLLKVANLLLAAGAEAIAINDQRYAANTEISCAGPTILINKTRIAPPFVIKAIGNSRTLMAAVDLRGGVIEVLRSFGILITAEIASDVKVPAIGSLPSYRYAKAPQTNKTSDLETLTGKGAP